MSQSAFVLRIAPSGNDRVPEALANDQLIIGWADATGLLNEALEWEAFREIVHSAYHAAEPNYRRAGAAAGHIWRFIRGMKPGDLVVVPYWADFYLAEVVGPAMYDPALSGDDSSYRRTVRWLNDKKPIPRRVATSALISRMKIQGTSADAIDLLEAIKACLAVAETGQMPTFQNDLQARLIREVLAELREGRMESYGFERLIASVLQSLGSKDVRIVPRGKDKGADLLATFLVAGAFQQVVAVQAKHWQPEPPVGPDVVQQLINGIEAESANLGMVITSGSISEEAAQIAEQYFVDKGIRIELIDGFQFAKLIVEHGITTV
jgi:predicted Mrr-cat superfamily restriction endonuclease